MLLMMIKTKEDAVMIIKIITVEDDKEEVD